jgi:hypothetical protein
MRSSRLISTTTIKRLSPKNASRIFLHTRHKMPACAKPSPMALRASPAFYLIRQYVDVRDGPYTGPAEPMPKQA